MEQLRLGALFLGLRTKKGVTKESITDQTYCSENLPQPLFAKEGKFLPFAAGPRGPLARRVKGGKEGFSLQGLHYFGLTGNFEDFKNRYHYDHFTGKKRMLDKL
jgi:hypothetical protein